MKDRLFRILGVEPEEVSMVTMLLTQSVFLGIFFGAFDISAHSLFLSVFDEKAMARAYVVSGLSGIILTGIYTWLQARLAFRNFAVINLVFITVVTLFLWLALIAVPGKLITFALFVLLGPLNILAMLGFWGTTGRLFSLRQGKRLFGLVDAGLIIGVIISCYAIPVLLSLSFSSHNIILISAASVAAGAFVQLLIGRRFTFVVTSGPKQEKKPGLSIFRTNDYVRIMGVFIALSVMTAFFVQYSFMAVTRLQYPLEEDMARFLGLFTGSMMIFTLLIKLLVFSYLIRNYGLKTCLAISPVLIAGFTALAIIIGMTMGYTPASASGFIIFFLILALSRLFSKALKDSIESPSFKVVYQTVDEKIRYEVQSGIDGTINEIAALSSGLLLAGLGALSFVKLIHFSWVLFIIIAAWIYFAFRLYVEYRGSIRKSLEAGRAESDPASLRRWEDLKNRIAGKVLFKDNYYRMLTGDLSVIDMTSNQWFFENLIELSEKRLDPCMIPALKRVADRRDISETLRHRALEIADRLAETGGDPGRIPADEEKLINPRRILSGTRQPQTAEILKLLRDNNTEAKRYAVFMIGKFRLSDMIPEVCDCLGVPGLEHDSRIVVESFGREAYGELFRTYLGSSGNITVSKSIITLLGSSSEKENTDFIFARLWSNSRRIREIAAEQLLRSNYKPSDEDRDRLNQLVTELIGMLTWNIAARASLSKTGLTRLLEVINNETASWNNFLFNVLSIAYDRNSVEKIKVNIESGTVASVNFALEMIDIVIDESIKPRLTILVDAIPDEEKAKNLSQFYPGEIQNVEKLFDDILNRDYNFIGIWAKACALRSLQKISGKDLEESVTALLFSPEKILREEAARLIRRTGSGTFEKIRHRIPGANADNIEKLISGSVEEKNCIYEKVSFLSGVIPDIPQDDLLPLAESLLYSKDFTAEDIPRGDESLLWPAGDTGNAEVTWLLSRDGKADPGKIAGVSGESGAYILKIKTLEEFRSVYPERSLELFYHLDKSEIKTLSEV